MGRLSWIIWLGSKCNHKVFIRETEGDFTHTESGEGHVKVEPEGFEDASLEDGNDGHRPRNAGGPEELEEARSAVSPKTP